MGGHLDARKAEEVPFGGVDVTPLRSAADHTEPTIRHRTTPNQPVVRYGLGGQRCGSGGDLEM